MESLDKEEIKTLIDMVNVRKSFHNSSPNHNDTSQSHSEMIFRLAKKLELMAEDLDNPKAKPFEADTGRPGLIYPNEMNYVPKPWGYELWICNNEAYCGKKLFIKQGRHLSYHHHNVKDEVLYVESGKIIFTYDVDEEPMSIEMPAGYAFHVTPYVKHQMRAIEDTMLIEFSTQHFDSDSYRTTRELVHSSHVVVKASL